MRGSVIMFQQNNTLKSGYGKWITDIVWGTTTDENERDVVEVGKFGSYGYVDVVDVRGIELTEVILLDYGFIPLNNGGDVSTYYRDDFGYVKLDTYGIEHVYMKGKPIRYLHDFQRIFFDYKGYILYPKPSEMPKKEFKSAYVHKEEVSSEKVLNDLLNMRDILNIDKDKLKSISIDLDL